MKIGNGTHPSAVEQFYSTVMLATLIIYGLLIMAELSCLADLITTQPRPRGPLLRERAALT